MSNGNGKDTFIEISQDDVANVTLPRPGPIDQGLTGQYRHYLGHGGRFASMHRPKCRLPGCNRKLKVNDLLACCPEHEDLLVQQAKWILSVHRGILEVEVE